jgi:hypothetical protein
LPAIIEVLGGAIAINVVHPDTGAADGLEVFGGGENGGGHLGLRADDKSVVLTDDGD